jgi:hypothetical protein
MENIIQPLFMMSLPILVGFKKYLSGKRILSIFCAMGFMSLSALSLKYNLWPEMGNWVTIPTVMCGILGGFILILNGMPNDKPNSKE